VSETTRDLARLFSRLGAHGVVIVLALLGGWLVMRTTDQALTPFFLYADNANPLVGTQMMVLLAQGFVIVTALMRPTRAFSMTVSAATVGFTVFALGLNFGLSPILGIGGPLPSDVVAFNWFYLWQLPLLFASIWGMIQTVRDRQAWFSLFAGFCIAAAWIAGLVILNLRR
jgi:hypothetical protein